jgi:hypothetical protein
MDIVYPRFWFRVVNVSSATVTRHRLEAYYSWNDKDASGRAVPPMTFTAIRTAAKIRILDPANGRELFQSTHALDGFGVNPSPNAACNTAGVGAYYADSYMLDVPANAGASDDEIEVTAIGNFE